MRIFRRPSLFRFFFAASFIATVVAAAHAQAQTQATLTGSVVDASGAGVAGARVVATQPGQNKSVGEILTGADGRFTFTLAAGKYKIEITHETFATVQMQIELTAGQSRDVRIPLDLEPLSASVVVTAASEPELAGATASPVDVLTRPEMDRRQEIWLTPLLASLPGASFSQLGPMGGSTTFFLDGGNSNYMKVLVDGVPVDMSEPGFSVDFSNLSADGIDKIEVVHGASSALYGSDAMSGVMQIFTHRGTTQSPEIVLEADGGTFGTAHGDGQISQLVGPFDYSVGGAYFDTNGQVQDDYFRDSTLSGNFGWKFSDTDSLHLSIRNSASDAGQPGQTLLVPLVTFPIADFGEHSALHDFASSLTWNFKTGEHWNERVLAYDARSQDTTISPLFEFTSLNKFNRAGLDAQTSYLFTGGGITVGYMFEEETGDVLARHDNAGYLEVRRQFRKRWTAIAGARIEANDSYGTRFIPRLGASYLLREGRAFWGPTRLRASFGEGIKEPPIFPPDCSPILNPEQSTTFDAGVDQNFDSDRVRLSVNFFHNDFHNIVSFTSSGDPSRYNCPAFFGSYFNTDKARAFGSDASLEIRATRWLSISGNYSYDDSRVLDAPNASDPALVAGNRLFKRPLHSANLTANAHFRRMNWNLAGYYVGRRTDSDFLGLGIESDPSYVRWDLANSIVLGRGLSTVAAVDNLFNRHYSDAVGYPALRLNYRLGLKYTWGKE